MKNNLEGLLKYLELREKWYYFIFVIWSFLSFNPCYRGKFPKIALKEANLSSLDLSDLDFSYADIEDCDLSHTRLLNTNFSNAKIKNCNFANAICNRRTNFSGAILYNNDFYLSDFAESIKNGATITSMNVLLQQISEMDNNFRKEFSETKQSVNQLEKTIEVIYQEYEELKKATIELEQGIGSFAEKVDEFCKDVNIIEDQIGDYELQIKDFTKKYNELHNLNQKLAVSTVRQNIIEQNIRVLDEYRADGTIRSITPEALKRIIAELDSDKIAKIQVDAIIPPPTPIFSTISHAKAGSNQTIYI